MEKNYRPVQNQEIAWREIDGEAVLVISDDSDLKVFNGTGTQIWKQCDGQHKVSSIAQEIAVEYEVTHDEALADVIDFLMDLRSKGLID